MAPGHARRLGFVDLVRADDGRIRKGGGIGDEGFEEFARIAHRDRIRHHRLRRLQILFGRQARPGVEQLAMHNRALQHHCARADIVETAVIVEGEGPRGDQHELKAARRQMQMEIGRAGVGAIDRQIGRDFVEQEGFVVGVKAFVGAVVERLRTIRRFELRIPVAIDRHKIPGVEAKRRAVRMGEAGRLEIARSMHVHDVLRSAPLPACNVVANFGPVGLRIGKPARRHDAASPVRKKSGGCAGG
ncbi:hypothetical protein ACVWYH_010091 [Bradyrhizobium sp. GM24.11]